MQYPCLRADMVKNYTEPASETVVRIFTQRCIYANSSRFSDNKFFAYRVNFAVAILLRNIFTYEKLRDPTRNTLFGPGSFGE